MTLKKIKKIHPSRLRQAKNLETTVTVRVLKRVNQKTYTRASMPFSESFSMSFGIDMALVKKQVRCFGLSHARWSIRKVGNVSPAFLVTEKVSLLDSVLQAFSLQYAAAFAIVLLLLPLALLATVPTKAYFNSEVTGNSVVFSSGTLTATVSPAAPDPLTGLLPDTSVSQNLDFSKTGSLPLQYIVSLHSDNSPLCQALQVTASDGSSTYGSLLDNFVSATTTPITSPVHWNFTFGLPSSSPSSLEDLTCNFFWTFTSWQTDLPTPNQGFSSIQYVSGTIVSGHWYDETQDSIAPDSFSAPDTSSDPTISDAPSSPDGQAPEQGADAPPVSNEEPATTTPSDADSVPPTDPTPPVGDSTETNSSTDALVPAGSN
jgi:hypothetical protein